ERKSFEKKVAEVRALADAGSLREAENAMSELKPLVQQGLQEVMYDEKGQLTEHGKKRVEENARDEEKAREERRKVFAEKATLDKDKFEEANRKNAYNQSKEVGKGGGGTAFLLESSTDPLAPKVVVKTPNIPSDKENMRRELDFYNKIG